MVWDGTKTTEDGDGTVESDEQLTADEWNQHVTDGHWPGDELNLGVNGDGDPVLTDPQNGGEEVLVYDRSAGEWVTPAISTEQAEISGRPVIEDGEVTVYVPTDFPTIQEAVDATVALATQDFVIINVEADYGEKEDVVIPPHIAGTPSTANGESSGMRIQSATGNAADALVQSVSAYGCCGVNSPNLRNLTITGRESYDNEDAGIMLAGCYGSKLDNIVFDDTDTATAGIGVEYYNSSGKIQQIDFGANKVDHGIQSKRGSSIVQQNGAMEGTCNTRVANIQGGYFSFKESNRNATVTDGPEIWRAINTQFGIVQERDNNKFVSMKGVHFDWRVPRRIEIGEEGADEYQPPDGFKMYSDGTDIFVMDSAGNKFTLDMTAV